MRPRRIFFTLALLAVATVHLSLAAYFVAPDAVLSDEPIRGADFDTHIGQTMRVIEGLDKWGALWVYDVQLLAGQPEGTIFDADNKGWEIWTYLLWKCGLTPGRAFNMFPAAIHVLNPLVVGVAAALFGMGAWCSLLAAFMASAIWWFDSWAHWCWWIGMVSYATASVTFLLPLALFYRFATRGSIVVGVLFIPALAICHLIHPYSFFMLVVPLATIYLHARPTLRRAQHLLVGVAVLATVGLNSIWLTTAVRHWHYILDSAYFGATGIDHLVADFFNLLIDPSDSGVIGTRAAFRFLFVGMSIAAIGTWWRADRGRAVAVGSALIALFVFGYLGSAIPGVPQMQPYRYVLPLSFLSCVGASGFVQALAKKGAGFLASSVRSLSMVIILVLSTLQHLAGDIVYFMIDTLPPVRPLIDGTPAPLAMNGYPPILPFRIPQLVEKLLRIGEISAWVSSNTAAGERVLVDNTHLGERLAWKEHVEVIGGFRHRNIAHSYANFFRRFEKERVEPATLERYLRTYAIKWIVLAQPRPEFEQSSDLFESLGNIEGYLVYKVRTPATKVLNGGGTAAATTNRIVVDGSDGSKDLVLSYHYHEQLVCQPTCSVERHPIEFDPVGFIRVPAPHPANLEINLQY